MGDFLLVYLESDDALKMFQTFAGAKGSSDTFLKDGVLECTGVDLSTSPCPDCPPKFCSTPRFQIYRDDLNAKPAPFNKLPERSRRGEVERNGRHFKKNQP